MSVESVRHGGKDMAKVVFERHGSDGSANRMWAILDPSGQWAIQECGADYKWGTTTKTVEYQPSALGVPVPKIVTMTLKGKNGVTADAFEYVFSTPSVCKADASEFTLAKFGLSEVASKQVFSANLALWWVVPTLILLIGVFVLRRWRRVTT